MEKEKSSFATSSLAQPVTKTLPLKVFSLMQELTCVPGMYVLCLSWQFPYNSQFCYEYEPNRIY